MDKTNKGGAPLQNQNAVKGDPEDKYAGTLYVKCRPGEKFLWRFAGRLHGGKLADWVRSVLNSAALELIKRNGKLPEFEKMNLRRMVEPEEKEAKDL